MPTPSSVDREWEEKTTSERKTRQEAAAKKEAEMKAAAASALVEHKAQRQKAAADTLAANKAAEEAEAAEMKNETNPWNTICACTRLIRIAAFWRWKACCSQLDGHVS